MPACLRFTAHLCRAACIAAGFLMGGTWCAAEDAVYLADDDGGETRVVGEIVDYTGAAIRVRQATGLERSYPGARVSRVETAWTAEHVRAEEAFAIGDFRTALAQYRLANRAEPRVWARRKILADVVRCHRALGEIEPACDTFLLLVGSDPQTPYFDCIPLAWEPNEGVSRQKALTWLDRKESETAMLLGASHLLATDMRERALAALVELTRSSDERIVALAMGQTWLTQSFRADQAQCERWAALIEKMPEPMRAGPYYVVGQTLARLDLKSEAALTLMRVPVLYPQERHLAAAALVRAAKLLAEDGDRDAARRLVQEAVDAFSPSPAEAEAQALLNRLQSKDNP